MVLHSLRKPAAKAVGNASRAPTSGTPSTAGYVAKPLLGREGAGVTLQDPGTASVLREEPCCYQELAALPNLDGNHVVLRAWVVENESAGLGIRESSVLIMGKYARFLPHVIL